MRSYISSDNTVPNDKYLDLTKFKEFADDNFKVAQKMGLCSRLKSLAQDFGLVQHEMICS